MYYVMFKVAFVLYSLHGEYFSKKYPSDRHYAERCHERTNEEAC